MNIWEWIEDRIRSIITRPEMYGGCFAAETQILTLLEVLCVLNKVDSPTKHVMGLFQRRAPGPCSPSQTMGKEEWEELMTKLWREIDG